CGTSPTGPRPEWLDAPSSVPPGGLSGFCAVPRARGAGPPIRYASAPADRRAPTSPRWSRQSGLFWRRLGCRRCRPLSCA
ncbi:MAG: hypothetical protein AVDCRST_MAG19-4296, partial [uncultured Thermomicrobiales bacterium]